jgi:hypothetical protein
LPVALLATNQSTLCAKGIRLPAHFFDSFGTLRLMNKAHSGTDVVTNSLR